MSDDIIINAISHPDIPLEGAGFGLGGVGLSPQSIHSPVLQFTLFIFTVVSPLEYIFPISTC